MMKRYKKIAVSQYVIVGLILIAIVGFGLLSTTIMQRISFTDQFAIPWASGRAWLLEGTNPYDQSVVQLAEEAVAESDYSAELPSAEVLLQPLINLFFYLPFSLIPFEISRAIWVTLSALLTGVSVFMALKLSALKVSLIEGLILLILGTFWLPGAFSILSGALTPVVIMLILLSVKMIMNGQETAAGFLLALTFGSMLMTGIILLFLIIWAISVKRWTLIKAYFAGLLFILIISWLLLPSWPLDWLNNIINYTQDFDWVRTPLIALAALLPGIYDFLTISLHALLGIFLLIELITVVRKTGQKFLWKLFTIFIIAFLFHVQVTFAHLLLLLPGAYFVFRFWTERWRVYGRLLSWGVILLMTIGSWLLVLPEISFTERVNLPVLIIILPITIFVSMLWIRWWAFQIPRLDPGLDE
jgi:hypothetical protein